MSNKQEYIEFCKKEQNIPIFLQPWWLDLTTNSNWNALIYKKGGEVFAVMPYYNYKRSIFSMINMPIKTQFMGPFIKYPAGQQYNKKLSWEKDIMSYFIENLPKFDYFEQNFSYKITNWLPFMWADFEQTTTYTYRIAKKPIVEAFNKFDSSVKRAIKKAIKNEIIVKESDDFEEFFKLNQMTYNRQKASMGHDLDFVKRLYQEGKKHNSCKINIAYYRDRAIAANLLIYDNTDVYYLMGGIDPEFKNLGAMDLIQYESIKFALSSGRNFDFEGSVIESIEKYFRKFGAIQAPYFKIKKTNSKILKIRSCIKEISEN